MNRTITANVIAASECSRSRTPIYTFEVEFPRIILAENNTHRMLSKNSQSTRAVPLQRAVELTRENPFIPQFTVNERGMAANTPVDDATQDEAERIWTAAMEDTIHRVQQLECLGVSKQYAGRLLEPFQHIRVVMTGTDWNNYFWLRDDEAAQPEIRDLARAIKEAMDKATPVQLSAGDWHLPYYKNGYWKTGDPTPPQTAIDISVSCCAQVSYRRLDDSEEKAEDIIGKLMGTKIHASPFEHQATPMTNYLDAQISTRGQTHVAYSGNFRDWTQYRKLIKGHERAG